MSEGVIVIRKPSVYQSRLTKHWIVDEWGGFSGRDLEVSSSQHRQGWRRFEDAIADALTKFRCLPGPGVPRQEPTPPA